MDLRLSLLLAVFSLEYCVGKSPNFVIFLVDDFGWGDVGANWASTTTTPNMDKMAEDGLRLTDFHAGASYCTPSRAALLTGRLGLRTGVTRLFGTDSVGGLPSTEMTLANVLRQTGYRTFALGKWHLGHRKEFNPISHGFDYYFGVPYSLDNGCLSYPGANYPRCPSCEQLDNGDGVDEFDDPGSGYVSSTALPLFRNEEIIEQPLDLRNLSQQYVNEFDKQVQASKASDLPFFGYVPFSHMHVPHGHASKYNGVSQRGIWFDTLKELDDSVGAMLDILERKGMKNDTFVFLFGDNGPWESKCDLAGSIGPFRGLYQKLKLGGGSSGKFTTWEGGHRVPGLAYWPGMIPPGVSDSFISAMDLFPTVLNMAGGKVPQDRQYDGVDISKILFKERNGIAHKIFFHPQIGNGSLTAARHGSFKIVYSSGGKLAQSCGNQGVPEIVHNPPLLFDLQSDPAEEMPLDTTLPEHKVILAEVHAALKLKMTNIEQDLKSKVNWSSDPMAAPCCNRSHPHCFCD